MLIARAHQEVSNGDRLTVAPPLQSCRYVPRAPDTTVRGRVIAGSATTVVGDGTYFRRYP